MKRLVLILFFVLLASEGYAREGRLAEEHAIIKNSMSYCYNIEKSALIAMFRYQKGQSKEQILYHLKSDAEIRLTPDVEDVVEAALGKRISNKDSIKVATKFSEDMATICKEGLVKRLNKAFNLPD